MALLSKISQIPKPIRDQLNQRLEDGQLGPVILPWLNAQPEVQQLCRERFRGIEVSDQNLSNWRETGYAEWQTAQARKQRLRHLGEVAVELAPHAGQLFAGGGAIAAGHIMELLEDLDVEGQENLLRDKPESFTELLDKLAKLTAAQTMQERVALDKEKHVTSREKLALDREKYESAQVTAVLKWAKSKEVQDITKGPGSNADKIATLRRLMFPSREGNQTNLPLAAAS